MLRYARHYGLARPPSYDREEISRNCRVQTPDDSTLEDISAGTISFEIEKINLTRDVLVFLQAVLDNSARLPIATHTKQVSSALEVPLETHKQNEALHYEAPTAIADLVADVPALDVQANGITLPEYIERLDLEVARIMDEPVQVPEGETWLRELTETCHAQPGIAQLQERVRACHDILSIPNLQVRSPRRAY